MERKTLSIQKDGSDLWKCLLPVLQECQEVALISDDMIGPLYDIRDVYRRMDDCRCDFWGLIRNEARFDGFSGKCPVHIDPGFLVIRQSCFSKIRSEQFRGEVEKAAQEGLPFLTAFVYFLEKSGCRAEIYCNTDIWKNDRHCNNFCFYYGKAYELVKDHKCPFIPGDIFATKNLITDDGRDARRVLEYIVRELKYSERKLWEMLLRRYDIGDLYRGLHLDYILSDRAESDGEAKSRAAVIIHVYYGDLLQEIVDYVKNIPDDMDVYITTSVKENVEELTRLLAKQQQERIHILTVPNRGRDCSALLIGCRELVTKYEYLCFVHDKKTSGNHGALTIGETFRESLFENLLGSRAYIENILKLFDEHEALGLLAPPIPVHGQYFCLKDNAWTSCFDKTVELADKIGVTVRISRDKKPFVLSTAFWCRVEALKPLWEHGFAYEDFSEEPMPEDGTISHAIERILPYVAQAQGYYSGIVMSQDYASLQISNLDYQLCRSVERLTDEYSISTCRQFEGYDKKRLYSFCESHKEIYIYGTGLYGKRFADILKRRGLQFNGFFVTEKKGEEYLEGYPIRPIREFAWESDIEQRGIGVIVAVSEYYQEEIVETLNQCGVAEYIVV